MFNKRNYIIAIILIQFMTPVFADVTSVKNIKSTDIPQDINDLNAAAPIPAETKIQTALDKKTILPLTLEEALKLADGQNIEIDIAKATQESKHLTYVLGLTQLLPNVVLQYSQSRFKGATQGFGGQIITVVKDSVQPIISANYTIYTGGSNIFALIANKRLAEAQKSLTENSRQDILRQVAIAYYTLQQEYWRKSIAEQAIHETEEQLALNEARYQNGLGLKLDMLQTQTLLSTRKQALIQAENNIAIASNHMTRLLNLDFDVIVIPVNVDIAKNELISEETSTTKLLEIARNNNYQIKSLEQTVSAGKATYRSALTSIFPQVTLTAYAAETGPALNQTQYSHFQGIQATTNLLTGLGFGAPTVMRQAKVNARLSELQLAEAQKLMEEDLSNSVTTIRALHDNIEVTSSTLAYARDAYKQAYGRLKEGVGINLDLQTTTTALMQARLDYVAALLAYNQAQVNLMTNLGLTSIEHILHGYTPETNP